MGEEKRIPKRFLVAQDFKPLTNENDNKIIKAKMDTAKN